MARSPRTPSSHAASTTAGPLFEAEVSIGSPAPRARIGLVPVALVGALVAALGADPILLALPAAMAASWGFMLPAGTGPNALAWATGHIAMPRVVRAGLLLDLAGVFLMVGIVWGLAALT